MKARDPAFLFYPGDFLAGTTFFSDEQIGKYLRLLLAQFNNGHLSEEDMLLICKTYDNRIFSKFQKDDSGNYFNVRLESEILKRKRYSESRANNRKSSNPEKKQRKTDSKKRGKTSRTYVKHMENENINENEIKNINENENKSDAENLKNYENWTSEILDGNDHLFETMFVNSGIPAGDYVAFWVMDHRDLLSRYPKMRPPDQQAFRNSCIKHLRENFSKPLQNGKPINRKQEQTNANREFLSQQYGDKLKGKKF